jgi:phosphatidylinositol-3-phosphatase
VAGVGSQTSHLPGARRRVRRAGVVGLTLGLTVALGGCTGASRHAASTTTPAGPPPAATGPRGPAPTKLLVVVMENHSSTDAAAGMPRLRAAARRYGRATDAFAVSHPSLPNYLAIAGGSTFGVHDDNPPADHRLAGRSVFGQVLGAGKVAKTYAESMRTPCQATPSGRYAVKHNPWPYFGSERAACLRYDVPAGTPSRGALHSDIAAAALPTFGLLVPDKCNDAHDCSLGTADRWLGRWLDVLLAGPDFRSGRLAVVVTFDEDDNHSQNQILTAVLHKDLHGSTVRSRLDHLALSRSVSALVGRAGLRGGRTAPGLLAAFGLARTR